MDGRSGSDRPRSAERPRGAPRGDLLGMARVHQRLALRYANQQRRCDFRGPRLALLSAMPATSSAAMRLSNVQPAARWNTSPPAPRNGDRGQAAGRADDPNVCPPVPQIRRSASRRSPVASRKTGRNRFAQRSRSVHYRTLHHHRREVSSSAAACSTCNAPRLVPHRPPSQRRCFRAGADTPARPQRPADAPHAELLTGLTVGSPGIPVIECQCGDAGGGEPLFVLGQQHLMGGPRPWASTTPGWGPGPSGRVSQPAQRIPPDMKDTLVVS